MRQWKNENESCLRWDSNPRHSVLRTDALPTELPRYLSWQGPNHTSHTPVKANLTLGVHVHTCIHVLGLSDIEIEVLQLHVHVHVLPKNDL